MPVRAKRFVPSFRAQRSARLAGFVAALACGATTAVAAPARTRVLVFDSDTPPGSGPEVTALPDLIARVIAAHPGYEVVPAADLHRAVKVHQKPRTRCAVDKACLIAVARATHAEIALTSLYRTREAGFRLELVRVDAKHPAVPERAVEESPERGDLARRTELCVDRLFKWPETVTPPPVAAVAPAAPGPVAPAPQVQNGQAVSVPTGADSPPILAAVPHRESVALISVTRGDGFSEAQASTLEELLLGALDATGKFKVIGQSDIDAVLSLEARKQSVGCSETDCAVQIAAALGVDLVATANVGRLGSNILLTLKVISVRTASVVARGQETVQSDNDLPNAARALANDVVANRVDLSGAAAPGTPRARGARWQRVLGWVGIAVGGALLATGAGLGISSLTQQNEIHTSIRSGASALQIMNSSNSAALGADVGLIAGGVLGAGGVALVVAF